MNVTGKIYVFANHYEDSQGNERVRLSTNVGAKDKDGNIISRIYIDIRFAGDKAPTKDQLAKFRDDTMYTLGVNDGFLDARVYKNKEGENVTIPVLVILDSKVLDAQKVKKTKTAKKKTATGKKQEEESSDIVEETGLPF